MSDHTTDAVEQAADVQATFCATLVHEWQRGGVSDAVVSPGSRSTPLALALVRSALRVQVVVDERSAAFVALGLARGSGRPVVLLCTSGSAAAQYHAAVVEADLDRVPLIVCTADRPPELHGIGAPQTLDQQRLYGRSTRWFADPGVADDRTRSSWRSFASRAVEAATTGVRGPGPVHLNLPFREPLVGTAGPLPDSRDGGEPWVCGLRGAVPAPALVESVAARLRGRRGVLVTGAGGPDGTALGRLASLLDWPVLADPRSGARSPGGATVAAADAILRDPASASGLRPEVVVRFGAPWASKVLGSWLAAGEGPRIDDLLVDPHDSWLDPGRSAALHLRVDADALVAELIGSGLSNRAPEWKAAWRRAEQKAQSVLSEALGSAAALDGSPSDPAVARAVVAALPDGGALVVSSSMPVRDVEWYGEPRHGLTVHGNRGANGIDGIVSTVVGVALAGRPTVGLLGDLAFLHDAGGLLTMTATGATPVIVVVDNAGGAIFEFLPQSTGLARDEFELLFGTPQPVDVAQVARGYGLDTTEVATVRALTAALAEAIADGVARVIVIRTDRRATVEVHDRLHAAVRDALR